MNDRWLILEPELEPTTLEFLTAWTARHLHPARRLVALVEAAVRHVDADHRTDALELVRSWQRVQRALPPPLPTRTLGVRLGERSPKFFERWRVRHAIRSAPREGVLAVLATEMITTAAATWRRGRPRIAGDLLEAVMRHTGLDPYLRLWAGACREQIPQRFDTHPDDRLRPFVMEHLAVRYLGEAPASLEGVPATIHGLLHQMRADAARLAERRPT